MQDGCARQQLGVLVQRRWLPLAIAVAFISSVACFWRRRQAQQMQAGGQVLQDQNLAQDPEHAWQQEPGRVQRQRQLTPGLDAELALNRMLFQASHERRLRVIAVAWGLKEQPDDWMDCLLRRLHSPDSADRHNEAALRVMAPPDLRAASCEDLVKFLNRAGIRVQLGMLPADPESASDEDCEPLRRTCYDFVGVYQFFRTVLCWKHIKHEDSAALALLGLKRLAARTPGYDPERRQRMQQLAARQAQELRAVLLDDQHFLEYLPEEDRNVVLEGELESDIARAVQVLDRWPKPRGMRTTTAQSTISSLSPEQAGRHHKSGLRHTVAGSGN
ncbi:hypothetical protein ABPG75_000093 [Micractinium tetrahymenae]